MTPDNSAFSAELEAEIGESPPVGFSIAEVPVETDDEAIARLAKLLTTAPLEYERCRDREAEKLRVRVSMLDRLVNAASTEAATPGRGIALADPEPWEKPVETAELLNEIVAAIVRHVILPAPAADVIALWIAHTWVFSRFDYTPRLGITSPTRRCGKSTLLEVLRITCRRTLKADNISASGVFRTVEALSPLTLLTDEADTFLKDNEELRGVLNSGFEKSGQVIRIVERNDQHEPIVFRTFCPVALAAIGALPSTLEDRAVPIRLERKTAADKVSKLRSGNNREALAALARKLSRWARDCKNLTAEPQIPEALTDREGDISVPLLSIAEAAGPAWATRGRRALLTVFGLRAAHDDAAEVGAMLLADLKTIFIGTSSLRMSSADIVAKLATMDDRPWPEWRAGKPITPVQLATALRPFGIRPTTMRIGNDTAKGYTREAFEEAWSRYLLPSESAVSTLQGGSDPLHRNIVVPDSKLSKIRPVTPKTTLRVEISEKRSPELQCYGVTGRNPPEGGKSVFPADFGPDDEAVL